jgi:hypothetical protein
LTPPSSSPQREAVMPHALGIDFGSVAVKLALVDADGKLLGV